MQPLVVPTVHLNGTSREGLIKQWRDVAIAAQALLEALCEAMPHGRDFYVQSPEAGTRAREAHQERIAAVVSLIHEARAHGSAIVTQE